MPGQGLGPSVNTNPVKNVSTTAGKIKALFPEIGDVVTTSQALELCRHFGLEYIVARINGAPNQFKPWKFDGCSCLPDELLGLFIGCHWPDITYKCCLPHDLCYAYGEPGNHIERRRVDIKFFSDLVTKARMQEWMAEAFLAAVRIGGHEVFGVSFSWGFARK